MNGDYVPIASDDYFQKVIASKLESISKMMSTEPTGRRISSEASRRRRRFMQAERKSFVDVSTNSHKRTSFCGAPATERINTSVLKPIRRVSFADKLSATNPNFYPSNCFDRVDVSMKMNEARLSAELTDDSEPGEKKGNHANVHEASRNGPLISDPDFKADIASKIKSKAISNLLFKVKEDINVKKLNEMKTRPEAVAEKALLMCDLKSYNDFVEDLFATGAIPVFRDAHKDAESKEILDPNSKMYAAKKELENLERMVEKVFGEDFHDRTRYQAGFFSSSK